MMMSMYITSHCGKWGSRFILFIQGIRAAQANFYCLGQLLVAFNGVEVFAWPFCRCLVQVGNAELKGFQVFFAELFKSCGHGVKRLFAVAHFGLL